MIYILQTSSAVCLCSLNSGCHDESTHNVPSHLGSHCLAMMSNATKIWPNFVIQHPCVDAPTAHCAILQKIITSTNQHIYNFVHLYC